MNALERVAIELKDELAEYPEVEVKGQARVVLYQNNAHRFDPYTEARVYRTYVRSLLKHAKMVRKQKQQSKQGSLFG